MTMKKWCFVPLVFISANLFATDYIQLEYAGNKASNCSVFAKYFDGKKTRFSCSGTDRGVARKNGNVVKLYCKNGDKVRHVNDAQSAIYISSTCGDTWLSKVRIYNDKDNKGKGASQFYRKSQSLQPWVKNQKNNGSKCYRNVNANSTEIRILPNYKSDANYSCKYITFTD